MKIVLDPSPRKAVLIAVLLFFNTFLASMGAVVAVGQMPTPIEVFASLVAAGMATTTYLLGFLGYGKEEEPT